MRYFANLGINFLPKVFFINVYTTVPSNTYKKLKSVPLGKPVRAAESCGSWTAIGRKYENLFFFCQFVRDH